MTQIIISGVVACLVSVFLTPVLIKKFSDGGIGQEIREDGPASHFVKRGTPTMGGIAIIIGLLAGYIAATGIGFATTGYGPSASGLLVLGLTLAMGAIGFADDSIKVFKSRNLGLNKTQKLVLQFVAAIAFGLLALLFKDDMGYTPASTHLSFIRDLDTVNIAIGPTIVGVVIFLAFIYILVAAWTNAVNLTDGLDGLAAGTMSILLGAYTLITWWQFRNSCSSDIIGGCYAVRDPFDLALITAAALGGCLGFLWWNAHPAKIFMGDTGSLALGGLVAGVSVMSRTELLMVIIGGIFVVEAASVVIQVIVFKSTGKRFFKMAPIHHHFEHSGWAETTVVVRFCLIALGLAMLGVSIFYGEWLSVTGAGV